MESSTIKDRLADECDLGLDQLSAWSGVTYARVRQWADGEVDITDEEQVRIGTIVTLFYGLHERLVLAREVLDETFPRPSKNGSGR